MPFDWRQFQASEYRPPAVVDPRRRMRIFLVCFSATLLIVFGRGVQLEITQGDAFREEALRPTERTIIVPAARGRIVARNGATLAYDRTIEAVAVHYRWLQDPPDARWLRATARARLSKADRRNAQRLASEQARVLAERGELASRLAALCGLSAQQWAARTRAIQVRVERIAAGANRRRQSVAKSDAADPSWPARLRRLLMEEPAPEPITVAEELAHHVVVRDVSAEVAAEIRTHADKCPGTQIVELSQRTYPFGTLAAHVLGHLGPVSAEELYSSRSARGLERQWGTHAEREEYDGSGWPHAEREEYVYQPDDLVGRMGVEQQYEAMLRARSGKVFEQSDRSGRVLASYRSREPVAGRELVLTLDIELQRTAEELLQSALKRRAITGGTNELAGGAIVVMDVRDGAIRAAASAPSFDPNLLVGDRSDDRARLLADTSRPLFDRVGRMAIPPGSTFKVVTAAALLESATVTAEEPFHCQGYLHQPDRQRCQIYVRQGVGHGEVAIADALAVSCNVYFFHFAGQMGPRALVDWAGQFGFGRPTGVDLPGEAAGLLPSPENMGRIEGHAWRTADTQSMAIGQGSLTATPLQVLRMMAAVANGGKLVTPYVACGAGVSPAKAAETAAPQELALQEASQRATSVGLSPHTQQVLRESLRRVVTDTEGTAHAALSATSLSVAGKTGTAETGEGRASHAWFAGYIPAEEPKLAFVVVLEHAGDATIAAVPVAKRLVARIEQLGLL